MLFNYDLPGTWYPVDLAQLFIHFGKKFAQQTFSMAKLRSYNIYPKQQEHNVTQINRTCTAAETMTCPHCHASVPLGATVCRGCKAEVSYGAPFWTVVVVFFLAVVLAVKIGNATIGPMGWGAFFATFFGGHYFLERKLFVKRVQFARHYRT